jgi:signal transduction histidine kinase
LAPRHWSLRVRLAVILLVPGIFAVVLGGLQVANQTADLSERGRATRFASVQGEVATLVHLAQQERYLATQFVAGGRTGDIDAVRTAFDDVDQARETALPAVEGLFSADPGLTGAHDEATQVLDRLPQLRDTVLASDTPALAVITGYSGVVAELQQLDSAVLRGADIVEVGGLADALDGLSVARNEASLQLALVTAVTRSGQLRRDAYAQLLASDAILDTGLTTFDAALDPGQRARFGSLVGGQPNSDRGLLVDGLLTPVGAANLPTADAAEALFSSFLAEIDGAETGIRDELVAITAARQQSAVDIAAIDAVLALLALLIGGTVVGLIASTMISSLRALRGSALDIAERRLPDAVQRMRDGDVPEVDVAPVPVSSREEVGEVARAFDAVHAQAVRLAVEQATLQRNVNEMFINLSRRSQALVDRQLLLIEGLESKEPDPDQLTSLFRLDHLATRMRRNSENLLVLAGTDVAKRSAQRVPVVDVMQAAVSEVEHYERVTVTQPPAVLIIGRAASDLQHLLAELLDNATSFSSPNSRVTMSAQRAASGALVIEITDRGIGMSAAELADTNRLLGRRNETGITESRRMGLFVVGRLAARIGVEIRLVSNSAVTRQPPLRDTSAQPDGELGTGLTACVTIPSSMIVEDRFRRPAMAGATVGVPRQRTGENPQRPAVATAPDRPAGPDPRPRPAGPDPVSGGPPTTNRHPAPVGPAMAGDAPARAGAAPAGRPTSETHAPLDIGAAPRRDALGLIVAPGTPQYTTAGHPGEPMVDPSVSTPIFEEVASGWFRSDRRVPVGWSGQDVGPAPHGEPARRRAAHNTVIDAPTTAERRPPAATTTGSAPAEPGTGSGSGGQHGHAPMDPAEFATSADAGWRAVADAAAADTGQTGSGLPRRTPGARLVPGSAGAGHGPNLPAREADSVRSRLSDYQRGVRQGRHVRNQVEPNTSLDTTGGSAE